MKWFFSGPEYMIIGGGCWLQPLKKSDVRILREWFLDPDLLIHAFGIITSSYALEKIGSQYLKNLFSSSTEVLGIFTEMDGLVGFINYYRLMSKTYVARIGILLGLEKFRSRGIGTNALKLALYYLFNNKKIHVVELDTAYFNTRAQHCFEKCGFKKTNETTDINFLTGELVHKVFMELKREDFMENLNIYFDDIPVFRDGRFKALPEKPGGEMQVDI